MKIIDNERCGLRRWRKLLPKPELAEGAGVCAARAEELGSGFEELENFFVLFRSEIGAHAHVHRRYVPLGGT